MHTSALAIFGLVLAVSSASAQEAQHAQQPVEMDPPIIVDITGTKPAEPVSEEKPEPQPAQPPAPAPATIEVPAPAAGPEPVQQQMCPALRNGGVIGTMIAPISQGKCGEASPVLMTGVKINRREIPLAMPLTVNCPMATAFADWVKTIDAQAKAFADVQIASVTTGGSMVCRGRVGTRSRGLSEHAFANAVDVHGFILSDGRNVDVLSDWRPADAVEGVLLRGAHQAGCERFTTVLGPEANAAHRNHFHFDLKARSSVICR